MDIKNPLTVAEYCDNFGFGLKNKFTIFKTKELTFDRKEDWFAHGKKNLKDLFTVESKSDGLLVVFIIETMKAGKIRCQLILTTEAYQKIVDDKTSKIIQVHQMYKEFFRDHISLNMET